MNTKNASLTYSRPEFKFPANSLKIILKNNDATPFFTDFNGEKNRFFYLYKCIKIQALFVHKIRKTY